jgi:hypothetical protein
VTAPILPRVGSGGGWRGTGAAFVVLTLVVFACLATRPASSHSASPDRAASAEASRGSVRLATTGDYAELRERVPIARRKWAKKRVVMSVGPGELPRLHRGDIIRTSAEVQISTTCIVFYAVRCIGKRYSYSPREDARIVLANRRFATGGREAKVIRQTRSMRCHQPRPHRNHHCVLVFPPQPTKIRHPHRLPCRPNRCFVNLVLEADYPRAKDGQVILVGADRPDGTVRQDKGRLNAIVLHDRVPPAKRHRTEKRRSRSIPIAPTGREGRRVIFSQRISHLKKGDVLEMSANHVVSIASLPYPTFVGTHVILTHGPRAVIPAGIARAAVGAHGDLTETNGFNCTHGPSAYRTPCRTRKTGAVRIRHTVARNGRFVPLYLNVVAAGKAKRAEPKPHHRMRVLARGALKVRRFRAPR